MQTNANQNMCWFIRKYLNWYFPITMSDLSFASHTQRFIYMRTQTSIVLWMQAKLTHIYALGHRQKFKCVCHAREETERNQNKFANLNKSYCEIIASMNYVCFTMKNWRIRSTNLTRCSYYGRTRWTYRVVTTEPFLEFFLWFDLLISKNASIVWHKIIGTSTKADMSMMPIKIIFLFRSV